MQQLYIPSERLKGLKKDKKELESLERICKCKISVGVDDQMAVEGQDAFGEFTAKNVLHAYGRGFEMKVAELLAHDDCYFESLDLEMLLGNEKRIHRMKSRIIGESGRTKTYIESVSGAKLSIYGNTVSFIGSSLQINEAQTAVNTLIEGGTHKLAYLKMEAAHRKNKANPLNLFA
jgi:ribosomal RNA assembly protein